jgi:excisionase family DNA binding protein
MTTPILMTAAELAQLLGVSKQRCYRWTDQGLIPGCRRFGRAVYWVRPVVEEWLREGPTTSTENGLRPQDLLSGGQGKTPSPSTGCESLQTACKRQDTRRHGAAHGE